MTSKPLAERRKSDNGNGTSPYLSPVAAQGGRRNSTSGHSNRLLPSPFPPQTASSTGSQRPQSRLSGVSHTSRDGSVGGTVRKSHSQSVSSTPRTLASSNRSLNTENNERQRAVRTLPPWVQSADDGDEDDNIDATSHLLLELLCPLVQPRIITCPPLNPMSPAASLIMPAKGPQSRSRRLSATTPIDGRHLPNPPTTTTLNYPPHPRTGG